MKTNWALGILYLATFATEAQPVITTQPTNQVASVGSVAIFSISVSGTGPFQYQWQFNGTNLSLGGVITTVAGNGNSAPLGDGGAATNAALFGPKAVAVDTTGNLFISDGNNNRVRKVNTNGTITTLAGGGTPRPGEGDGGTATNAALTSPYGVAVDGNGNLFVADYNFCHIRKVATNGIITSVAGNGIIDSLSGDGGAATNAGLANPTSVALDSVGNLFIADGNNNRIRTVDTNGIITTVAGIGSSGLFGSYSGDKGAATNAALNYPSSVAVDSNGNLFIADYENQRIRKVDTNGIITTVAGNATATNSWGYYIGGFSGDGGAATNAELYFPTGIAVDAVGNLYIADQGNNRIRMVDANGTITTVAGNGTFSFSGDGGVATSAGLNEPAGVALDSVGNLFIADGNNNRIRKLKLNSPTMILNNVTTNNAGKYSVIISDSSGSVTSSVATLAVGITPSITNQPQSLSVTNGHIAGFTVAAAG